MQLLQSIFWFPPTTEVALDFVGPNPVDSFGVFLWTLLRAAVNMYYFRSVNIFATDGHHFLTSLDIALMIDWIGRLVHRTSPSNNPGIF
jgi:hypothetical protein